MVSFLVDIPSVFSFFGCIPIQFIHNRNILFGEFQPVQGAGTSAVFHLMIDGFYRGRLRLSAFDNEWVFDGEYAHLAAIFSLHLAKYSITERPEANGQATRPHHLWGEC